MIVRRALVFVALTLPAATAQDASPGGAAELLKGAPAGYNAALEGERRFGLYFADRIAGEAVVTVERAPEGSNAVYRVTSIMKMELADVKQEGKDVSLLDERFSIVERTAEESGSQRTRKRRWFREGKERVLEVTDGDGKVTTRRFTSDAAEYGEESLLSLMFESAGGAKPGTYKLPTVNWPEGAEPNESFVELKIDAAAPYDHRGKSVQANAVHHSQADGDRSLITVDAAGKFLSIRPDVEGAPPIRMIAGTAEELAADKKVPSAPEPDSPAAAVQVFLEVLTKQRKPDELDQVIDWTAVRDQLAQKDPNVAGLTPEAIAGIMKQNFANRAGPKPDQMAAVLAMLKTEIEGEQARVIMPGQEKNPILLSKREGKWWITRMPGM